MRGKHGEVAARRREVQIREKEAATYQAAVARLTAENRDLKAKLDARQQTHAQQVRKLEAMLDEAVSPAVTARDQQIRALKDQRDRAERDAKQSNRWLGRATTRLCAFLEMRGWTRDEAMAFVAEVIGEFHTAGRLTIEEIRNAGEIEVDYVGVPEHRLARTFDRALELRRAEGRKFGQRDARAPDF